MATESIVVREVDDREQRIQWDTTSPLHLDLTTRVGEWTIRHGIFRGGVSEGVEIVRLKNSRMHVDVLPTRGMSIWRIECDGVRFGWHSPVIGPVHPNHVPVSEPSGLGWLSGFDELVVRCGLHSNGAPQHAPNGQLEYPLHGHIANTPADSLSVEFDEASGRVELIADTVETRLFFKRFRMRSKIRIHADRTEVELLDDVTNELETPQTMQLLYHINLGSPILGEKSRLVTALDELAPKDAHAAEQMDRWDEFDGPTPGQAERVYFGRPRADETGYTHAMLMSPEQDRGFAVSYKTSTLPAFVLWKNTAAESDGYVTGMEPATGFPNRRDFEEQQGRLVDIGAGETKSFRIKLQPFVDPESVETTRQKIQTLTEEGEPTEIFTDPRGDWTDLDG
ncbi:MAG: aldose 1-epimerase family protein [Rhodopirellula sp. JB055]|uniref:aldose 1-epimerase family protein n=1 Tax=Rhodopirellula sp. JB055 TaxID=3342846 RepID=UPI00370A153A